MLIATIILSILVIGAGIFLLVWHLRKKNKEKVGFDYTTKYGIRVKLSQSVVDIKSETFDEWTESVVNFWENAKGWPKNKSLKVLSGVAIIIYDYVFLNRQGIKVVGITHPFSWQIEIAAIPKEGSPETYKPFDKVKSLFRHETSHVLAARAGDIPFDNEVHHKLFADMGLGA